MLQFLETFSLLSINSIELPKKLTLLYQQLIILFFLYFIIFYMIVSLGFVFRLLLPAGMIVEGVSRMDYNRSRRVLLFVTFHGLMIPSGHLLWRWRWNKYNNMASTKPVSSSKIIKDTKEERRMEDNREGEPRKLSSSLRCSRPLCSRYISVSLSLILLYFCYLLFNTLRDLPPPP